MLVPWVVGFECLEKIIQEKVHINLKNYAFSDPCELSWCGHENDRGMQFFSFVVLSWWANNFREKKDLYERFKLTKYNQSTFQLNLLINVKSAVTKYSFCQLIETWYKIATHFFIKINYIHITISHCHIIRKSLCWRRKHFSFKSAEVCCKTPNVTLYSLHHCSHRNRPREGAVRHWGLR